MANKPKSIGTAAETATVRWLRDNGFPWADRQPLRGNRDAGDIAVCPGVIAEVKAHKTAGKGQPGDAELAVWMAQTEKERIHAGAGIALLVVKRTGTTNPGKWWCYLHLATVSSLLGVRPVVAWPDTARVCMSLASAVALLRHAGWGESPATE